MPFIADMMKTISGHTPSLIEPGDRLLVAVSGGPDSLALLHAIHAIQCDLRLGGLFVAHVDHLLRGAESAAEAEFVRSFCVERDIDCKVGRVDVMETKRRERIGKNEAARVARYAYLDQCAAELGANKIATAHTQDDRIESVLLNIIRGAGIEGLRGIPSMRLPYVRPLIDITRDEIEQYCSEIGLVPRRDPTNLNADSGTRNRVRLDLLPELERGYHPGVKRSLLRLSTLAQADDDYLSAQAAVQLAALIVGSTAHKLTLNSTMLRALHPALCRRCIRLAIQAQRGSLDGIDFDHVEAVREGLQAQPGRCAGITLPGSQWGITANRETVVLSVMQRQSPALSVDPVVLTVPSTVALGATGWVLEIRSVVFDFLRTPVPRAGADYQETLDRDQVDFGSLRLRAWTSGDRMAPLGMHGRHKKLQDLFTDRKIPREDRRTWPVIEDDSGILWAPGLALDERARTSERTSHVVEMRLSYRMERQ